MNVQREPQVSLAAEDLYNEQRETQVSLRNLPSFGDQLIAPQPKERGNGENLGFSLFVLRLLPEGGNLGFSLFVLRLLPEGGNLGFSLLVLRLLPEGGNLRFSLSFTARRVPEAPSVRPAPALRTIAR